MARSWKDTLVRLQQLFDAASALVVIVAIFTIVNLRGMPGGIHEFLTMRVTVRNLIVMTVFLAIWRFIFTAFGLYHPDLRESLLHRTVRIVKACSAGTCFLALLPLVSKTGAFGFDVVCYFWLAGILVALFGRVAVGAVAAWADPHVNGVKQVIIVGSGPRALALFQSIRQPEFPKYHVLGFVDSPNGHNVPADVKERMIASLEDLEGFLSRHVVDEVLIALPVKSCYSDIQRAIEVCERIGVPSKYLSDIFPLSLAKQRLEEEYELPIVRLQQVPDDHRIVLKRVIDMLGAFCGLIVLSPLMLACAALIKLTSRGPVLFSQERFGLNRRLFRIYKFRTMVAHAEMLQQSLEAQNEAQGPVFKIRRDPRVTAVGRFMRKASLDELPQLYNVLRGDMSLVGPRPLPLRDVSRFSHAWLMRRFSVKPGLTCLWQVTGRSNLDFDRWVELDLAYIDNWSLSLDFRILLKTVPAVLSGSGAV